MSKKKIRKWGGNREAQRQADNAFAKLRPKNKKKSNTQKRRENCKLGPLYFDYIRSSKWRRKRNGFIKQVGGKCERCGSDYKLQVHHKHYRTLGEETKRDVEVLCKFCHECEHEKDGVVMTDELSTEFRAKIGT